MFKTLLSKTLAIALAASFTASSTDISVAQTPAKKLFGGKKMPASMAPASHGFYSKGCLSGAQAMPYDGPTWQVMRLSRNRRWGHPNLIETIEKLSIKAKRDGWNGLLVGDISQPRGGPMLTGHASHQIGLDADIWFTPMPDHRMNYREREDTSAVSVLKRGTLYVDDKRWKKSYERLLYHAASFPQVERLLVHPGIKKKLCETVKGDRSWLNKVRPYYGHHYHFHIRIGCQPGSPNCKRQASTGSDIGCGAKLDWWYNVAFAPRKPSKKPTKPRKPKPVLTLAGLPAACEAVLQAPSKSVEAAVYQAPSLAAFRAPKLNVPNIDPLAALRSRPIEASTGSIRSYAKLPKKVPVPIPRPLN